MRNQEWLNSPQGQYSRYKWRKGHGYSHYSFNFEPKIMKSKEKALLQNDILNQMKKMGRYAFRGDIAVEISIYPTSKTPPHIHTISKRLIDIFWRPVLESSIKRKGLIFADDKQIAYLSIKYNLGTSIDHKGFTASITPFGNFLQDITLAEDILRGNYGEPPDSINEDVQDDNINNDYYDILENKDKYIRNLGQKTYDSMLLMAKHFSQKQFLENCKLRIMDIYLLYASVGRIKHYGNSADVKELFRKMSESLAHWIPNIPIRMKLPRIPINNHETKEYRKLIYEAFVAYKQKFKLLDPLYIPVALEVIYKPPLKSINFIKDLDNIMRDFIIPIFHDIYKPPPTFMHAIDLTKIHNNDLKGKYALFLKDFPKSVPYSVSRYEIFKIDRHENDEDDGFLCIGITHGSYSLWNRVDKAINEWQNDMD